jgi:hypothetical protein
MERTRELRRPVYVKPCNHTKLHYAFRSETVSPEEHEIKPQWIKAGANRGSRQQNKAWIKNLANSGNFAVALHEIGHGLCDPDKNQPTPSNCSRAHFHASLSASIQR